MLILAKPLQEYRMVIKIDNQIKSTFDIQRWRNPKNFDYDYVYGENDYVWFFDDEWRDLNTCGKKC